MKTTTPEAPGYEASLDANCPLSIRQQNRNLVLFGINKSLTYLAASVVYVGSLDAILLNTLGYSDKVANLPVAAYMWTTAPFLVLFTWYFCQVRMLKPVLVIAYAVVAASGVIVVLGLIQPSSNWIVAALIVRATLMGWFLGVVGIFEWEILARGVAEHRRGFALSFAFGLGPVMAVLGSFATQLVLDGKLGPISVEKASFPWEFIILYAASVLVMGLPVILATRYIVPSLTVKVARKPLVSGVFGGFGDFLKNRLLMLASIAFLVMIVGSNTILPSVILYTRDVLGEEPQKYAGYQFALRFGFKALAGVLLGWMLVKTHPRAGLVATTSLCLTGIVWALLVPGKWYFISFGILGAGELYFIYYQNYLVSCSPTSKVRRNLAYAQLLVLPASLAPIMFGLISDTFGLKCSIEVAAVLLAGTVLFVHFALPRHPASSSIYLPPSNVPDEGVLQGDKIS